MSSSNKTKALSLGIAQTIIAANLNPDAYRRYILEILQDQNDIKLGDEFILFTRTFIWGKEYMGYGLYSEYLELKGSANRVYFNPDEKKDGFLSNFKAMSAKLHEIGL